LKKIIDCLKKERLKKDGNNDDNENEGEGWW
jgi:hypothetical protein